jgi:pimeloyl-ACP methyl ester carboxylesterase
MIRLAMVLAAASVAGASLAAQPLPTIDTIANRRVESLTLQHPTSNTVVVFENGSRNTLDKWGRVLEDVGHDATVFAYNRPGYGNSEDSGTPRDGRTIVEELRQVLRAKGLRPPYVLVGHSLGGLYVQLFAAAHPDEVKGIVLVDALYPRVVKKSTEFPWMSRIAGRTLLSNTVWREIESIHDTGEAVLALGSIEDKPMISLINQPRSPGAIAVDFGAINLDPATRDFVRKLYPKAKRVVADSSHQMQASNPELVVSAIREIMASPARAAPVSSTP